MKLFQGLMFVVFICLTIYSSTSIDKKLVLAEEDEIAQDEPPQVDPDLGKSRDGSRTDDEVVQREEEAIKLDGLNVAQLKQLRQSSEKKEFVAEVNRMMKLIINSLYKNKEIFLRELISNASDALDKIRFMSLTDNKALGENDALDIRIKFDAENNMLHITDTGVGMTKDDMVKYLGTIAKSQTSEFLTKFQDAQESGNSGSMNDLIGQFGVGFYSAFLVADKVVVTSKHNDDNQHIWESDSNSFSVGKDPRGNTLGRGTTVSLHLKPEAKEFLEHSKLTEIITKYSQFITFNIYLWSSKKVSEEVPIEETEAPIPKKTDDEATIEEEKDEEKPKTKTVEKTVWDWELMNIAKPIWQRKPAEVTDQEYKDFYAAFSKDAKEYLAHTHFSAEGEVSFKSILFMPKTAPTDIFQNYNQQKDSIKMYVRRVFISETVDDLLPKYLSFVRGIVDSDDLPLNVSRETLQQSKLLKVIKKKLVRKILDMIKKLSEADYEIFWKEYGTHIKLGVIEDSSNKNRLSNLLRFSSSNNPEPTKRTSLEDYVKRMKTDQEFIYFIAGNDHKELTQSPFVERLLKKGYEVLYLIDPIDEYCMQSLPGFESKRFQNVAKDGLKIDKSKEAEQHQKELEATYAPLVSWIKEGELKSYLENVKVSSRLVKTPMALVASQYGYSGNMERISRSQAYQKAGGDSAQNHFQAQKKILEINPGHPLIKELLKIVDEDPKSRKAAELTRLMFESATLRSGYELGDTAGFADRIEGMLRSALNISADEQVDEEPVFDEPAADEAAEKEEEINAEETEKEAEPEVAENVAEESNHEEL